MSANMNLHKVFSPAEGYLANLRVRQKDANILRAAREEARQVIREAFTAWPQYVKAAELFEVQSLQKDAAGSGAPKPKFRMQGSWKYDTVNDCQQVPPQQVDMDDGIFLPVSFLTTHGHARPNIVSKAYFEIIEKALEPLCKRKGWILVRTKPSCVRILIGERLHLDFALYAIKDEEYGRLVKARGEHLRKAATPFADEDLFDEVYTGIQSDIMLAHREKGWMVSDPRKLELWVQEAVDHFGQQVRRLTRDFKGMRDARWRLEGPGSICIMAALVQALQEIEDQDDDRDDLALAATARRMAVILKSPVKNPALPPGSSEETYLCAGWNPKFRQDVCDMFNRAADALEEAIHHTYDRTVALEKVAAVFGERIPTDPALVVKMSPPEYIRRKEPEIQPAPVPLRTKSG